MGAVHVRELPDHVLEALKRRARQHHRSLQREIHAILHAAARDTPPAPGGYPPLQLKLSESKATGAWTRERMYDDRGR
jgi:hypothetical protein